MKVEVVGLGYVDTVTAACVPCRGHKDVVLVGTSLWTQPASDCEMLAAACVMTTGRSPSTRTPPARRVISPTTVAFAVLGGKKETDQSLGVTFASGCGHRSAPV